MSLLDLERKTWTIVVMYGEIPSSRWNHSMTVVESDKILVFGGKNLLSFCNATIHIYHTDAKKVAKEIAKAKDR